LTGHVGTDMGENKTAMAEKLLNINRGSYNNILVMKHKKMKNEIHTWNSQKVECHLRKLRVKCITLVPPSNGICNIDNIGAEVLIKFRM
jgi:hypothetical protein